MGLDAGMSGDGRSCRRSRRVTALDYRHRDPGLRGRAGRRGAVGPRAWPWPSAPARSTSVRRLGFWPMVDWPFERSWPSDSRRADIRGTGGTEGGGDRWHSMACCWAKKSAHRSEAGSDLVCAIPCKSSAIDLLTIGAHRLSASTSSSLRVQKNQQTSSGRTSAPPAPAVAPMLPLLPQRT